MKLWFFSTAMDALALGTAREALAYGTAREALAFFASRIDSALGFWDW